VRVDVIGMVIVDVNLETDRTSTTRAPLGGLAVLVTETSVVLPDTAEAGVEDSVAAFWKLSSVLLLVGDEVSGTALACEVMAEDVVEGGGLEDTVVVAILGNWLECDEEERGKAADTVDDCAGLGGCVDSDEAETGARVDVGDGESVAVELWSGTFTSSCEVELLS
jgi:hypothetical protein